MNEHGRYRVVGRRAYRGHAPGTEFTAKLGRHAALRAIARGDIELLALETPDLREGSYALPANWKRR